MTQTATKPASTDDFDVRYDAEGKAATKFAVDHKLTLKKVQIFMAGSEETICFTANIYANGKKIGYADNQGHGGPTNAQTDQGNELDRDPALERWVDDVIEVEVDKKEIAKTISKIKSATKRKGFKAFAYKNNEGATQYIQFRNADRAYIDITLKEKGYKGWTIVTI